MRSPHAFPPIVVSDYRLDRSEALVDGRFHVAAAELFAEPVARAPDWITAAYSRVLASSSGPVALAPALLGHGFLRDRVERARWPVVADGSDFAEVREAYWPMVERLAELNAGAGSPAPDLVLVGEADVAERWPFFARSGVWLLRGLRELGYDELGVYLTNARTNRGRRRSEELGALSDAFGRYEATWIALGEAAGSALRGAEIEHVRVPHPMWHRRFRYSEGPRGYAKLFLEAGVPAGPLADVSEAMGPTVAKAPVFPDPYKLPRSVAYRKGTRGAEERKGPLLEHSKARRACDAFVTGQAKTLRDAAVLVDANYDKLCGVARSEDWLGQREKHEQEKSERLRQEVIVVEVRSAANARRLAWAATERGLGSVVLRLQAGAGDLQAKATVETRGAEPLHPSPTQVEALARTALALSQANVGVEDSDRQHVSDMPWSELCRSALKAVESQFGVGALEATGSLIVDVDEAEQLDLEDDELELEGGGGGGNGQ